MYYAGIYSALTLYFISRPHIGIGNTEMSKTGFGSAERELGKAAAAWYFLLWENL